MPLIFSTGGRASSPQGLHHETSLEATACALTRAFARTHPFSAVLVSYNTLSIIVASKPAKTRG